MNSRSEMCKLAIHKEMKFTTKNLFRERSKCLCDIVYVRGDDPLPMWSIYNFWLKSIIWYYIWRSYAYIIRSYPQWIRFARLLVYRCEEVNKSAITVTDQTFEMKWVIWQNKRASTKHWLVSEPYAHSRVSDAFILVYTRRFRWFCISSIYTTYCWTGRHK